ncbi:hypothetical protein [Reyranella sp.]|uniref:hypothetical protein n=1 Tax=Reyranella sp. TaxID=1929291 RepID=UPI003C7C609F
MSRSVRWPRYEPLIVTTLRRYRRRGAPESLLVRLAGGPGDWRRLNATWNLDGRRPVATSASIVIEPIDGTAYPLSSAERRIGLRQLADECAAAGAVLPTLKVLGGLFSVSRYVIAHDLEVLRRSGQLDWHLMSDGATGVRRVPEAA